MVASLTTMSSTSASRATPGILLYNWPGAAIESELRYREPAQFGDAPYDIVIIGAGVVGCALAFECSKHLLRVLLVDRKFDVGEGTSKGNSAIIASGFDTPPGTLETELVTEAARAWPELAENLKIPYDPIGGLVLALDDDQRRHLDTIADQARKNGVAGIESLSGGAVHQLEPRAADEIVAGLLIPDEAIVDPFTVSIAFAEVALGNGVDIALGIEVAAVESASSGLHELVLASGGRLRSRLVINAAGLGAGHLARSYGGAAFDLNPRRGQFLIFDKCARSALNHIFFPVPTPTSRGILVLPTIFGNIIAGPTAEDLPFDQAEATETTATGLDAVLVGGCRLMPGLADEPIIGAYAGLRSNCAQGSYWLRYNDARPGIVTVAGIRSTGLSAAPALARHLLAEMERRCGLELVRNPEAVTHRPESAWPGWWRRPYEDPARMKRNPDYGRFVCFCEQISRGEIADALDSPLKPRTMDALKRRTRALAGRCQGFDCRVPLAELIAEHCGVPITAISKCGPGTELLGGG